MFGVMLDDKAGGVNSPLTVKCTLTLSWQASHGLIEAPLDLDDAEVLLSFLDGDGLVGLKAVCSTEDCCAVLMACPTEVSHWLHDDD